MSATKQPDPVEALHLTNAERKALVATIKARMRGESGTFAELLRAVLVKLETMEIGP